MSEYTVYNYHNDLPCHNFGYIERPILRLLNKIQNNCILDVGCGNGYLVNTLLKNGFAAYGIDASPDGIEIARKTSPDNFFIQDISSATLPIQLQNLKFDTIISTEVIEHLYDPEGFINFCKQSLNDKGEIIISTPYHGYLKNLTLSLLNKWDSHMSPLWHGGHIKLWSKKTLIKVLTNAGFTDITFIGCGRMPYLWKSMIIKARLN